MGVMLASHALRSSTSSLRLFSTCGTRPLLSGHNKWSKIKQKKGANDASKSAIYSKAQRDIVIAARSGGSPDPSTNVHLAAVLKRVKDQGVPKENIEKALNKVRSKSASGEVVTYEAMAIGSVGIIVECATDNTKRTIANIREILTDHGARMTPVKYMFEQRGLVRVQLHDQNDIEDLATMALCEGALDYEDHGSAEVLFSCLPTDLAALKAVIAADSACANVLSSELIYAATDPLPVGNEEEEQISDLVAALEEDDDTIRVWTTVARTTTN